MLSNLHTHSKYCDGKNTLEEMVQAAIGLGMCSIGFSGHGYTPFDTSYCMTDTAGYMAEVQQLKEKYKKEIEVYMGVEEDARYPHDKAGFDYRIGSSHYLMVDGRSYHVDSVPENAKQCLAACQDDPVLLAHTYYKPFCDYILDKKPDIVGHFDLITKFDEMGKSVLLENQAYRKTAEEYIRYAARSNCLFEVNTGAISRGYRTTPYPAENLLKILQKNDVGVVISSDSHDATTLTYGFEETKQWLKDIGFSYTYVLSRGAFVKDSL